MNCPYCNEKMEIGEMRSQQGCMIYWEPLSKDINKMRLTKSSVEKHDGIILANAHHNMSNLIKGYVCKSCKKYIMSYE